MINFLNALNTRNNSDNPFVVSVISFNCVSFSFMIRCWTLNVRRSSFNRSCKNHLILIFDSIKADPTRFLFTITQAGLTFIIFG